MVCLLNRIALQSSSSSRRFSQTEQTPIHIEQAAAMAETCPAFISLQKVLSASIYKLVYIQSGVRCMYCCKVEEFIGAAAVVYYSRLHFFSLWLRDGGDGTDMAATTAAGPAILQQLSQLARRRFETTAVVDAHTCTPSSPRCRISIKHSPRHVQRTKGPDEQTNGRRGLFLADFCVHTECWLHLQ